MGGFRGSSLPAHIPEFVDSFVLVAKQVRRKNSRIAA